MDITICGHRRAAKLLAESPNTLDILMLSSPDSFFGVEGSSEIPKLAKDCKQIAFHDIDFPRPGYSPPSQEQIREALDWAKGRKKIIVACQAGISRSSGTAYCIEVQDCGDATKALRVLDEDRHSPNMQIVRHGADILGKPEMVEVLLNWKYNSENNGHAWQLDDNQVVS